MCRKLFEIQFLGCKHTDTWEKPSPISSCTGIIHNLTLDSQQLCKSCWVKHLGHKKKSWLPERRLYRTGSAEESLGKVTTMEQPIQSVDAAPSLSCPTWKRRYDWHTRQKLLRDIKLRRADVQTEIAGKDYFNFTNNPTLADDHAHLYFTDSDVVESAIMRLVEPEDAYPEDGRCNFCYGYFLPEHGEDRAPAGDNGRLRKLPCRFGHTFCMPCLRQHFLFLREQRRQEEENGLPLVAYNCPYCRDEFEIVFQDPINIKLRLTRMVQELRAEMLSQTMSFDIDNPPLWPEILAGSWWLLCTFALIFALPMLFVIEHSMGIFQSKSGPAGKLPYLQIAVLILVGVLMQALWIPAVIIASIGYAIIMPRSYLIAQIPYMNKFFNWRLSAFRAIKEAFQMFFGAIFAGLHHQHRYQAEFWGPILSWRRTKE